MYVRHCLFLLEIDSSLLAENSCTFDIVFVEINASPLVENRLCMFDIVCFC